MRRALLHSQERDVPEGDGAGPLRLPQLESAGAAELPRCPLGAYHNKATGAGGNGCLLPQGSRPGFYEFKPYRHAPWVAVTLDAGRLKSGAGLLLHIVVNLFPFVPASKCDDYVRSMIQEEVAEEFSRYAAVINDSHSPAVALEVVINESRAAPLARIRESAFMKYFVIATRDGVLSAEDFAQRLVSRWPGAEVTRVTDPDSRHALEFLLSMDRSHLDGSLNRRGSCIAFEANFPDSAVFALWCRSTIPAHEPLTFCDEGMHGHMKLEMTTTVEDLLQAFP